MLDDRSFSADEFRAALGAFATGIAVVTTRDEAGEARAMTVNSFSSVSLDPPLILFCLDRRAFHYRRFAGARAFAVNMLAAGQEALSNRFASESEDGFGDLACEALATGSPILAEALAALDCVREAAHEAGDHLLLIGRVAALKAPRAADPLLYFRGAYAGLTR
jgi:flavin reductase (DIM6/NTAB) family NADH-FMN oxidoreductase RutF